MAETPVLSEVGNSLFFVKEISLEVRTQKLQLRINSLNTSFE
ncbi:hypothetical protein [Okeania sp. SIO2B3]|nr:hypothetical protein [Okeania sp. SIO2B3]